MNTYPASLNISQSYKGTKSLMNETLESTNSIANQLKNKTADQHLKASCEYAKENPWYIGIFTKMAFKNRSRE